jgi:transcriptional regulator with XRE-family HTH domain
MKTKKFREVLGEVIRETRTEQTMTLRYLSEKSNVALGYVSEVERGMKEASSEILEQLANGLDTPLYQIIVEAGYRLHEWNTPEEILDRTLIAV